MPPQTCLPFIFYLNSNEKVYTFVAAPFTYLFIVINLQSLSGRREIKVVVTCCRPDAAGLTVLGISSCVM